MLNLYLVHLLFRKERLWLMGINLGGRKEMDIWF